MRKTLFFILSLCYCISAAGQQRDISDAMSLARRALKAENVGIVDAPTQASKAKAMSMPVANKPYYVFNDSTNGAFAIISADVRMNPVLGICDETLFDAGDIPCGLSALLANYTEQAEQLYGGLAAGNGAATAGNYIDVAPMLTSKWGQNAPYNDNCPYGSMSGCVATGMAQVMRHHRHPNSGTGSFSYTTRTNNYYCTYNYAAATFDWDGMTDTYSLFSPENNRAAVANIMKACGVAVGMDYCTATQGGSGAYAFDVAYALKRYFKYPIAVYYPRAYFKTEEWYDIVHRELEAGRPLLYFGYDIYRNGGHAFVIDGYDSANGLFHVNWGWEDKYDGYYNLDLLNPGSYKYSSSQGLIAGFSPSATGDNKDTFYADYFSHAGSINFDQDVTFTLVGLTNMSNSSSYIAPTSSFSGTVGIGLYDSSMAPVATLAEKSIINVGTATSLNSISMKCNIKRTTLEDNTVYYVAPFVKAEGATTATRVRTSNGQTDCFAISTGNTPGGGGGEDNDSLSTLFAEGFNDFSPLDTWVRQSIQGQGTWDIIHVLEGNEDGAFPPPAEGAGYAFLSFDNEADQPNPVTVSRFTSPTISGKEATDCVLTFMYRCYTQYVNNKAFLSVYINKVGESADSTLAIIEISNHEGWLKASVPFHASGDFTITMEGNVQEGTSVYIDDLRLSKVVPTTVQDITENSKADDTTVAYDLYGRKTTPHSKGIMIRQTKNRQRIKVSMNGTNQ